MNYLAHSYLSCSNADILIGNFIADSISSKADTQFEGDILLGIQLHRELDHFTDEHPKVREAVALLRPLQGKYAPVVTDILWDHVLSKYWERYSGEQLRAFVDSVYKIILDNKVHLPEKLLKKIDLMIQNDFLHNYQSLTGLKESFSYMDKRARFPSNFVGAVDQYIDQADAFDELFHDFFPDLIAKTDQFCNC